MARGGGGGSHSSGRSSGGSHSGGSRSSSHSGGSGSFGGRGFSSSGRSSGSVHVGGNSGPARTGGNRRYGAPPPPPRGGFYGAPPPPPPRGVYYRRPVRRRAGGGCSGIIALLIVIIVVIVASTATIGKNLFNSTTKSDTKRDKLDSKYVNYVNEWYDDQLGWIGTNNSTLVNGLEDFYQATGIQPYLCLVKYGEVDDNDDARTEYIESLYDELFTDEGHLLFCYFACKDDSPYVMDGMWQYIVGKSTETVMDENAKDILESNFEYYYNDTSLDVDELFAKTFSAAGKSIMQGPIHIRYVIIIIVAIVAVVIIVALLIKWWKARAAQKNKEQEDLERMLDKPLETFGTDPIDDLKDKYDDK